MYEAVHVLVYCSQTLVLILQFGFDGPQIGYVPANQKNMVYGKICTPFRDKRDIEMPDFLPNVKVLIEIGCFSAFYGLKNLKIEMFYAVVLIRRILFQVPNVYSDR